MSEMPVNTEQRYRVITACIPHLVNEGDLLPRQQTIAEQAAVSRSTVRRTVVGMGGSSIYDGMQCINNEYAFSPRGCDTDCFHNFDCPLAMSLLGRDLQGGLSRLNLSLHGKRNNDSRVFVVRGESGRLMVAKSMPTQSEISIAERMDLEILMEARAIGIHLPVLIANQIIYPFLIKGNNLQMVGSDQPQEMIRSISTQLGGALAYLHNRLGIVHGDLSNPTNCIVDRYGRINILDFGEADVVSDHNIQWEIQDYLYMILKMYFGDEVFEKYEDIITEFLPIQDRVKGLKNKVDQLTSGDMNLEEFGMWFAKNI